MTHVKKSEKNPARNALKRVTTIVSEQSIPQVSAKTLSKTPKKVATWRAGDAAMRAKQEKLREANSAMITTQAQQPRSVRKDSQGRR